MKILIILGLFMMTTVTLAKRDVDFKSFNQKMNENIGTVLEENPHLYETKPINRGPASVTPVKSEKNTDKLDEVQEQADTHTSW